MNELIASWEGSAKAFFEDEDRAVTYGELFESVSIARSEIGGLFAPGEAIALSGEELYPGYVRFLALLAEKRPVFLFPPYLFNGQEFRARVESSLAGSLRYWSAHKPPEGTGGFAHPILATAVNQGQSPFVIRTSGSASPDPKFIAHDAGLFLAKYRRIGQHFSTTMAFSPFDSIAGVETLLEAVSHLCRIVSTGFPIQPSKVARRISEGRVDYFQTTPSFLALMGLGRAWGTEPMKELRKIAYGSEPAQKPALAQIQRARPDVELVHTYGMSEIGILLTETCAEDPTLCRPRADFNPWRLEGGALLVKSTTPMLGYLGQDAPEYTEGWFRTGDVAEEERGYLRILGRAGELINVAGRKFFPSELEALLLRMENVADVTVKRERNEFTGSAIVAEVWLELPEEENSFLERLKNFSELEIPQFMGPHRVVLRTEPVMGARFKKSRR